MSLRHLYKDISSLGVYPDLEYTKRCTEFYGNISLSENMLDLRKQIGNVIYQVKVDGRVERTHGLLNVKEDLGI